MIAAQTDLSRLERALIGAAARHAPTLVPAGWAQAGDYGRLTNSPNPLVNFADRLAAEGTLTLLSTLPHERARESNAIYQAWAEQHARLHLLLAETLFPSYRDVQALFADQVFPPIVLIVGSAVPVTMAVAAYITPFTAARRVQSHAASDVELRGLLDLLLDDLEADDLPRDSYRHLRDTGAAIVKDILASPVIPLALTTPAQTIRGETVAPPAAAAPAPTPNTPPAAPLPPDLPEQGAASQPGTPPIFFDPNRAADRSGTRRRPPIPDLPPRSDEGTR